jgi:hypothetical protein
MYVLPGLLWWCFYLLFLLILYSKILFLEIAEIPLIFVDRFLE